MKMRTPELADLAQQFIDQAMRLYRLASRIPDSPEDVAAYDTLISREAWLAHRKADILESMAGSHDRRGNGTMIHQEGGG